MSSCSSVAFQGSDEVTILPKEPRMSGSSSLPSGQSNDIAVRDAFYGEMVNVIVGGNGFNLCEARRFKPSG
jgi:hypothetical protein